VPGNGVRIWLDGVRVDGLLAWELREEARQQSRLTLEIAPADIIWGVPYTAVPLAEPAPIVDDGQHHFVSTFPGGAVTPSGKNACVTCGEAWPCSTYGRRGALPPEVDKVSDAPLS
jgi:hypothetical protein